MHDTFVNRTERWRLKLSAVLIYSAVREILKPEDKIIIDRDFDGADQKTVIRFIHKLFRTYHGETPLQQPSVEFRGVTDPDVKVADIKTKRARKGHMKPNMSLSQSTMDERFAVLEKIS